MEKKMMMIIFKLMYLILFEPFFRCFTGLFKRKRRPDFTNDIVLVTGAAQGLGKEIASQFADHGSILILWDVNEAKLLETCSQLTSQGHEAFAYVVDCSKREEVYQAAEKVKEEVGNVSVLVNNAGVMNTKPILELTDEDILRVVNTNFLAHYWTIKTFLPWMMKNDYGHIVSISSITAFYGFGMVSDYCAAKSAVLSLSESLTMELMIAGKLGISVTCVCPGAISTDLLKSSPLVRSLPFDISEMTPQNAARKVLEAVSDRKGVLICPWYSYLPPYTKLLLSEKAQRFIVEQVTKRMFQ